MSSEAEKNSDNVVGEMEKLHSHLVRQYEQVK